MEKINFVMNIVNTMLLLSVFVLLFILVGKLIDYVELLEQVKENTEKMANITKLLLNIENLRKRG